MGFLDHSTNNIIVDAVLTDYGRKKLAGNSNLNEVITSYGFADDEVDYTMIKKYGLIVGKEKIEKNTPVFEASTNAEYGVEYYLFTSQSPLLAVSTLTVTNLGETGSANILRNASGVLGAISSQQYQGNLSQPNTTLGTSSSTATFTISYDKRYLILQEGGSFGDIQSHGSNANREIAKSAAPLSAFSFTFQSNPAGANILSQRNVTSEMTQFTITSTSGHIFHQTIEVSY